MNLTLDTEAAELLLKMARSSRSRGEFVSQLIREKAQQKALADRIKQLAYVARVDAEVPLEERVGRLQEVLVTLLGDPELLLTLLGEKQV